MTETMTGGCLCDAIRFEVSGPPKRMLECHCTDCQKIAGGSASYLVGVAPEAMRIIRGEPRAFTVKGSSGEDVTRYFCPDCGTPIHSRPAAFPGFVFIKAGAFDDSSFFRSSAAVWAGSSPPWHTLPEGVPVQDRGSR